MKGFASITDDDLFVFLFIASTFTQTIQLEIRRVNLKEKSVNLIRGQGLIIGISFLSKISIFTF